MLIHEITLRGILSFGPDTPPLPMQPLNVLIGPNGSGKSNLISAIDFMRSSPNKLSNTIRDAGGTREWVWKGSSNSRAVVDIVIDDYGGVVIYGNETDRLRHQIKFSCQNDSRFSLDDEIVTESSSDATKSSADELYYQYSTHSLTRFVRGGREPTNLNGYSNDSILSQIKDPSAYPYLDQLSKSYESIRLYREWTFGRSSIFRNPQAADAPSDRLAEDFSNLGLFLNHLRSMPKTKNEIIERLRDLYEGLDDFDIRVKGGTVELFLTEGDIIIPASRLSDGTLRYLSLLAVLCDPNPPALICIEEPELGLHPDMIPKIADLLIAASQRTQLIVTTHSDILIDALTEQPESVVVMEKKDGKTTATRLQASEELQGWLQSYRLGQLWMRGAIGGTRW